MINGKSCLICGPYVLFVGILEIITKKRPKTTPETQGIYLGALVLLNLSRTAHLATLTMMMVAMIKVMSPQKQPKREKVLVKVKKTHDGNNIAMRK